MSKKIICIIPCRLQSTRLPGKAILPIQGKPMIQWTYENAKRCDLLTETIIATDSSEIVNVIKQFTDKIVFTPNHFLTGTERVAYVAQKYSDYDVVINLQGDVPFIKPMMLKNLIKPFLNDKNVLMSTLAYPLASEKLSQASNVKVITDLHGDAIYFSRNPIPFRSNANQNIPVYNHMGVYAFQKDFLQTYSKLSPTPLEESESLEQLRVVEHGYKIKVCVVDETTIDINTPEEYKEAQTYQYFI